MLCYEISDRDGERPREEGLAETDSFLAAGRHETAWNGTDRSGRRLPSGVYFARLKTVDAVEVKKLVLAK